MRICVRGHCQTERALTKKMHYYFNTGGWRQYWRMDALTLAVTSDVGSLSFLTTETGYHNEPGR
jgi:hypothetical protein